MDINPFAVAIARFRLLVAALHAAGDTSIEQNIGYTPHLAAGDSLLWGANQQLLPEDLLAGPAIRADATEDAEALKQHPAARTRCGGRQSAVHHRRRTRR